MRGGGFALAKTEGLKMTKNVFLCYTDPEQSGEVS